MPADVKSFSFEENSRSTVSADGDVGERQVTMLAETYCAETLPTLPKRQRKPYRDTKFVPLILTCVPPTSDPDIGVMLSSATSVS